MERQAYPPNSLHAILAQRGYTTRPAPGLYQKHILDASGTIIFTGDAHATCHWLGLLPTNPDTE